MPCPLVSERLLVSEWLLGGQAAALTGAPQVGLGHTDMGATSLQAAALSIAPSSNSLASAVAEMPR